MSVSMKFWKSHSWEFKFDPFLHFGELKTILVKVHYTIWLFVLYNEIKIIVKQSNSTVIAGMPNN